VSPLSYQQLAALNRLSSKKASDRRAWLEGVVGPLAAAPHTSSNATSNTLPPAAAAAAARSPEQPPSSSSSSGPVLPTGVDVSGTLGVVRGRVLPPPHLAYATPECAYPGSQVGVTCV
jgi:hypothetical protein